MKRFLSALLCAVLMLGLLPAASPPARMAEGYSCTVNKTSAFVGDILIWNASVGTGMIPYWYSFDIWKIGAHYVKSSGYQKSNEYFYIPPGPGTYIPYVAAYTQSFSMYLNFSGPETAVALRPAPAALIVEAISGRSLKLTWSKVDGADGYEIWRSTGNAREYKLIQTTAALSFTNTYLTAGTRYYFKIRAYNLIGGDKIPSSGFSAARAGVPLTKPAVTSAVGISATQVKLAWTKVTGATGYQVFQSAAAGGTYKPIKLTTALTFTAGGLDSGKTYFFKVRPYKKILTLTYYGPLSGYKAGKTK